MSPDNTLYPPNNLEPEHYVKYLNVGTPTPLTTHGFIAPVISSSENEFVWNYCVTVYVCYYVILIIFNDTIVITISVILIEIKGIFIYLLYLLILYTLLYHIYISYRYYLIIHIILSIYLKYTY